MRTGWKSLLLFAHKSSVFSHPLRHNKIVTAPFLLCCLLSSRALQPFQTTVLHSRLYSLSVTMGPSFSFPEIGKRVTRSSIRLFPSIEDDELTSPKKRKAPSTPTTTRTMRGSVAANGAIPVTPDDSFKSQSPSTPRKKAKSSKTKKKSPKQSPTKAPLSKAPPKGWQEIYSLVEELREDRSAPVDTDGSEALPETEKGPETYRFQVLIALMLSSQTKDAVVGETMRALQQHGLTVQNIQETSPERLNELIRKVGFHNNKTKYIKKTVEILLQDYNGDIPPTAKEMMDLPGVGPKMAFIVENVAFKRQTGIGVDTHMHRMFNQLRWVNSKNPEQTRAQLEAWLPKEYWSTVNLLWVGFGQEVQQFKPKMLRKALDSSRPKDALKLINRLGLDYRKEGEKLGWKEEIDSVLKK